MNVDAYQRQNHFLKLDLIDGAQTFMKMRRWIHVCSPLPDMSKDLSKKSIAYHARLPFVPVNRLALFVRKTRPMRNSGREVMGKIDKLFAGQNLLQIDQRDFWQRFTRQSAGRTSPKWAAQNRNSQSPAQERSFHTDAVSRLYKRKRTTSNNSQQKAPAFR